jgi:hypothetical protein
LCHGTCLPEKDKKILITAVVIFKICKIKKIPYLTLASVVDPDPDSMGVPESGSGSRRAKITHKNRRKLVNLNYFSKFKLFLKCCMVSF